LGGGGVMNLELLDPIGPCKPATEYKGEWSDVGYISRTTIFDANGSVLFDSEVVGVHGNEFAVSLDAGTSQGMEHAP
jgi:hypothetical protein